MRWQLSFWENIPCLAVGILAGYLWGETLFSATMITAGVYVVAMLVYIFLKTKILGPKDSNLKDEE